MMILEGNKYRTSGYYFLLEEVFDAFIFFIGGVL